MHDREKSHSAIAAKRRAGGAKGGDQEEREQAKHAPNTTLGSRVTAGGPRTASRTCDCRQLLEVRSVCLNWARTGPCEGRRAITVSTAISCTATHVIARASFNHARQPPALRVGVV